jgi:N-methylhydantoinase A
VQQPVEFVNFRAVHTFPLPRPAVRPAAHASGTLADAQVGERGVYFGGFVPTAIYERGRLPLGARLAGPAIVEQSDTTTVIPPDVNALVDPVGNLRLRRDPVRRISMTAIHPPSWSACGSGPTPSPTRWG